MIITVDVDTYRGFGVEKTKQNKRMKNTKPSKNVIETQNKTKIFLKKSPADR